MTSGRLLSRLSETTLDVSRKGNKNSRERSTLESKSNSMQQLKAGGELVQMRENVRQAVQALEVCWRCQRVSECQKYVLGNMVPVWLCPGCLTELHQPQCVPSKSLNHTVRSRETVSPNRA